MEGVVEVVGVVADDVVVIGVGVEADVVLLADSVDGNAGNYDLFVFVVLDGIVNVFIFVLNA